VVLTEAKKLVGKICSICWLDRAGREIQTVSRIHDATFVPLYGGYLITDTDDIRLDKITTIHLLEENGTETLVFARGAAELPQVA